MPQKRRSPGRAASLTQELTRQRVLEGLYDMRTHGWSMTRAAREAHTTPRTMQKYLGSVLIRTETGGYAARGYDRLRRPMRFLTKEGTIALEVRDSRTASQIGEYFNAVDRYLTTGRTDDLRQFRGQSIRVGKRTYLFVTDPRTLKRLGAAGEISFEDLYVYAG